ncbi:DMT family transporter [Actinoplanes sp. NPDC049316]|uniref:DMT family transporter n=1 Tax=Actinoplanes sp. NPDC049316 TaxID=3154727 RepID=UPI0034203F44
MRTDRRLILLALATAGLLWGTTVPLTKVALTGMGPAWLTVVRFVIAAVPLAIAARRGLRAAASPRALFWGAIGYGGVIVLQNAGIARTSVSHSALIVGATPVLVALLGVLTRRGGATGSTWAGSAFSLAGIAVIAAHGGGTATLAGDTLVGLSVLLSAAFLVAQPAVLAGRDPVAVTAVQFGVGAVVTLPAAVLVDGTAALSFAPAPVAATLVLAIAGTLVPFTLFAWGQSRVTPAVAGAFVNLEPLVGFALGVAVFGDSLSVPQAAGGVAVAGGLALTCLPLLRAPRSDRRMAAPDREPVLTGAR